MKSDLAQWLFTILKERRAKERFEYDDAIINSLQVGFAKFTREAYEIILEQLRLYFEMVELSNGGIHLPQSLMEQYGGINAEYPYYPRKDWQHEVANGDTSLGYWEWVAQQFEEEGSNE